MQVNTKRCKREEHKKAVSKRSFSYKIAFVVLYLPASLQLSSQLFQLVCISHNSVKTFLWISVWGLVNDVIWLYHRRREYLSRTTCKVELRNTIIIILYKFALTMFVVISSVYQSVCLSDRPSVQARRVFVSAQ